VKIQLINLAIADMLAAVVLFIPAISFLLDINFQWNISLCILFRFVNGLPLFASILSSTAISLERFVIVYFPLKASGYTKTYKYVVVVIIWLCASAQNSVFAIYAEVEDDRGQLYCWVNMPIDAQLIFNWWYILMYIILTIIIVGSYTFVFILLCLRKKSRLRRHSANNWRHQTDKVWSCSD
jgi:hypothetical protein